MSSARNQCQGRPASARSSTVRRSSRVRQTGPACRGGDPRTPDIIVLPNVGVVYTGSTKKQAEHGGFAHDDTNVMLLVSNPASASAP